MKLHHSLLLTSAIGTVATLGAIPAFAQTQPAAQPAAQVQEVVVTGSRIRRNPANAPAPLIQVTQDSLLQNGQPNIIDQLADIPALSGSFVPEDTTGNNLNDGGLSLLNLRQLGTARTLVLVDGKRHVGAPQGSLAVDVDSIPRLLIQRIDVTTGGQSALYGADAVSGVINYVMKKNFEGIEVDGSVAQINKEGQQQKRISVLAGKNFFNDRLNTYFSYEREEAQQVKDSDMKWRKDACLLVNDDLDPTASPNDNDLDNKLFCGLRNLGRMYSGTLVLANGLKPSPASDPDIALISCSLNSSNCFRPQPGLTYMFNPDGTPRLANFGSYQIAAGTGRTLVIGGDGLNVGTEFNQGSRVPESTADRFQVGLNFKFNDSITGYAEYKHVKEETFDNGQGSFFDVIVGCTVSGTSAAAIAADKAKCENGLPKGNTDVLGFNVFQIGLDNAYLGTPLRTAIQNNVRSIYNAAGVVTGTVADQRAYFTNFGPLRDQLNTRTVNRYVVSLKGEHDNVLFFKNPGWEVSYTRGSVKNENQEFALDVPRYVHAADAVVDTAGVVNGKKGEIVCRVSVLTAGGKTVADQFRGTGVLDANHPDVKGCVPFNIFGNGQFDAKARQWYDASIKVSHENIQQNALAFFGGELWDFWGAGSIGLAMGLEWRKETTEGKGRDADTGSRVLFLNTGPDFKLAKYEAKEAFAEMKLPLLKDVPFAKSLEFSGAVRRSDYSTVGKVKTYSAQFFWEVNDQVKFRGTRAFATRIPNLNENFAPFTQTFAQINDPCDSRNIQNTTNTAIRENRIKNCAALGIPANQTMTYSGSPPGVLGGNALLKPETSKSKTLSVILNPAFLPRTTIVFDWYNIQIDDAIAAIGAQTLVNQCVDTAALNPAACGNITRDPANEHRVVFFRQGSFNYARFETQGLDFTVQHRAPLKNVFGRDLGNLNVTLRGTYEQFNRAYTNIDQPGLHTDYTQTLETPELRFGTNVAWNYKPTLSFFWNMDFVGSQELIDIDVLRSNPDNREDKFRKTGNSIQHDFSVRWEARKNLTIRGGVVNAFNETPPQWLGSTTGADTFDMFGRRFYVGFNYKH
ncbi:MAG: TonB-dependent receptor domain-containing protein [Asticcacaulis sp.]